MLQMLEQKYFNRPLNTGVTVNNKKLAGLKFGESANKSAWRKKVWRIHPDFNYVGRILD